MPISHEKTVIHIYLKNKSLVKDESYEKLAPEYADKAKSNLITMNILFDINTNEEARKLLNVPEKYSSDEWIIVTAYYAMYSSATALLAKIGYKSTSHSATIVALEHFFLKKELLDDKYLAMFKSALLSKEEIDSISEAKEKREIAQYRVTKEITRKIAEATRKNAYDFVARVEFLLKA